MSIAEKIAELLQNDIQTSLEKSLCLDAGSAKALADDVFKELQSNWGGKDIYIPVRDTLMRNHAIRKNFNGRNHAEVCKQYGISLSHLYRIIKQN